jgi:hypothetical protein
MPDGTGPRVLTQSPFCVGIVTIVAAFDAATPNLQAIQPVAVFRALQSVYASLGDGVRLVSYFLV